MRSEVYRNLHTGTWSVRTLEAGPLKGLVTAHPLVVMVDDANFVVQRAGRDRVRREGRKNVHAFVRGDLMWYIDEVRPAGTPHEIADFFRKASYNPYENDTFVDAETGEAILAADRVVLDINSGVWYANWERN